MPTPDAFKRLHSETFPELDSNEITRLIKYKQLQQQEQHHKPNSKASISVNEPRNYLCRPHLVPYGPPIETVKNMSTINKCLINLNDFNYYKVSSSTSSNCADILSSHNLASISNSQPLPVTANSSALLRKLESIEQCVTHIFENNFKDAKKSLNSAFRALRDPKARLHLCVVLQKYVKRNQVILNSEQFEYICKLLNESLSNDTRLDEHQVAYSILPLTSAFYRKLNNGTVDQCIYTCLQQHEVWSNMQFWEMAFYTDVQRSIRPVYLSNEEFAAEQIKENGCLLTSSTSSSSSSSSKSHSNNDLDSIDILTTNLNHSPITDMIDDVVVNEKDSSHQRTSHPRPDNLDLLFTNGKFNNNNHHHHHHKNNVTKQQKEENEKTKSPAIITELNLNLYSRPTEKTALEICGEQMEKCSDLTLGKLAS
jgi:hypothetical protein